MADIFQTLVSQELKIETEETSENGGYFRISPLVCGTGIQLPCLASTEQGGDVLQGFGATNVCRTGTPYSKSLVCYDSVLACRLFLSCWLYTCVCAPRLMPYVAYCAYELLRSE
jgi:hypothetical protein